MKISFDSPRGPETVSAIFDDRDNCDAVLVFAHGAGAGMDHAFMERTSAALREAGVATLRFQFPYREQGRKPPDRPPVLIAALEAATTTGLELAGNRPLFVGGKSMGGRMASMAAAEDRLGAARGLVFFGFPLHPAGKPSRERAAHLGAVDVPMLFLQGTRDRLAEFALIETVCRELPATASLYRFDGADHSFEFLKSAGRTPASVTAEIARTVRDFIDPLA